MIDFNREKPLEKEDFSRQLEENLKMQKDCEIEIERCEEANDFENLDKTKKTLEILKNEEIEIRKNL